MTSSSPLTILHQILLLLFSHLVVSYSLQPHGLQHSRFLCPSLSPRVCSNSCPLSGWCYPIPTTILYHPLLLFPWLFLSIRVFPNESAVCIRWPKYWSFSFSPSNENLGLISFGLVRSPCCSRDSQESSPTPQFETINSSVLSLLYGPTLTSVYDYWKN